jgi:hypothetical protein
MTKQSTRRRRARCAAARVIAVAGAAALIAIIGTGQTLAATAPPDERVLERQGRIDRQATAAQADEQGKAAEPSQAPSAQYPRRYLQPEPPVAYGPPLDSNEPLFPAPAPPAQDRDRDGLTITLTVVALLLAVGAATTWRIHRRHPRPEPTA